jgi:hypothetical protein
MDRTVTSSLLLPKRNFVFESSGIIVAGGAANASFVSAENSTSAVVAAHAGEVEKRQS